MEDAFNVTRNNIKPGDKIMYIGPSKLHVQHGKFTDSQLKRGKVYTCSFVYLGEGFEQIELEENPEHLFIHDQFMRK